MEYLPHVRKLTLRGTISKEDPGNEFVAMCSCNAEIGSSRHCCYVKTTVAPFPFIVFIQGKESSYVELLR